MVVGVDSGGGGELGLGEAALEGGDVGLVLGGPGEGRGESLVEGRVEAISDAAGCGHGVVVEAGPIAGRRDGLGRSDDGGGRGGDDDSGVGGGGVRANRGSSGEGRSNTGAEGDGRW